MNLYAASIRVCFLLFESMRGHLKFQLEVCKLHLTDVFTSYLLNIQVYCKMNVHYVDWLIVALCPLQMYLKKLMDIITSENPKMPYEMKEMALEAIVQLWRIPSFVTELYINYDCDFYCSNLFEDLTKLLSKVIHHNLEFEVDLQAAEQR